MSVKADRIASIKQSLAMYEERLDNALFTHQVDTLTRAIASLERELARLESN
jgi:ubiquinone biosynthesis protein UbiJ